MNAVCTDRSVGLLHNYRGGPAWTNIRLTMTEV